MGEEGREFAQLDAAQLTLMRIRAALASAGALLALAAGESVLHAETALPRGILLLPALLPILYLAAFAPGRRFRAWGYLIDGDELHVRRGVLIRVHTIVPLERIQHIDLSQGPLERSFGLARLILHTAGTLHSQVTIPGLARATAERIRDEVRARILESAE
jgi:uncharacterized protein